jgi:hypothetical protein
METTTTEKRERRRRNKEVTSKHIKYSYHTMQSLSFIPVGFRSNSQNNRGLVVYYVTHTKENEKNVQLPS